METTCEEDEKPSGKSSLETPREALAAPCTDDVGESKNEEVQGGDSK